MHRTIVRLVRYLPLLAALTVASVPGIARAGSAEVWDARPGVHRAWAMDSFEDDARLAGRFVFTLDFDGDGTAWIATSAGLLRFDGYTWRRYGVEDGLPSDFVRCATIARDGVIWIGTDVGITLFDGERFVPFSRVDRLAGRNVRRITEDSAGTMWICSDTWLQPDVPAGLSAVRPDGITIYRERDGLPSDYVSDFFEDSQGRRFVLTREGLAQWDEGRWTRPLAALELDGHDAYMWSIAETPAVGVMVATERWFYFLRDGHWSAVANDDPGLTYPKVAATARGEIVTATNHDSKSFSRWNGAAFERTTDAVRSPGSVEFVDEAPDGSIWAVGMGILLRWSRDASEWTEYEALPAPSLVDAEGHVWFAGDGRVIRLSGDRFETIAEFPLRLIAADDGAVWGLEPDGVVHYRDGVIRRFGADVTGIGRTGFCVPSGDGGAWSVGSGIGGGLRASRFDGAAWHTSERLPEGSLAGACATPGGSLIVYIERLPRGPHVIAELTGEDLIVTETPRETALSRGDIRIDSEGALWLYGEYGAFRRGTDDWERATHLPGRFVVAVFDHGSDVWMSYTGLSGGRPGMTRIRNGVPEHFDLPINRPIWSQDRRGLFHSGPWDLLRPPQLGEGEPLPLTVPIDGDVRAALWRDGGEVWIQSGERVARYRPDGLAPETLIVESASEVVTGEQLPMHIEARERFRPRGTGSFTYSWRFDDDAWTPFAPLGDPGPIDLPRGSHRFEVRARDEGLDVDPTPASFGFTVLPTPILSRAWFWPTLLVVFGLTFLAGLVALISRVRIRTYARRLEGTVRDRTATLRASELRFRRLVEYAKDAFFLIDREGRILEVNTEACTSLGYERGDLIGRRMSDIDEAWDEARVAGAIAHLNVEGAIRTEGEHRRRDGSTFAVESQIGLLDAGNQALLLSLTRDITERKRDDVRHRRLMAELDHRVKNNLATVIALANQTLAGSDSLGEFREVFIGRIHSMARVHETLARDRWKLIDLAETIRRTLEPYAHAGPARIVIAGEPVHFPPHIASPLGLVFHELATNAAKHGALSVASGRLEVKWVCEDDRVLVSWIERGGPPVTHIEPGCGIELLHGLFKHDIRGCANLRAEGAGLVCTLSIPCVESADKTAADLGPALTSGDLR